jgi:uncharacterized protein
VAITLVVVTLLSVLLGAYRLRLDPDVDALLPSRGEAAALRRYLRAFGGGGLGVVLVEGTDPAGVARASDELAARLEGLPSVASATARVELAEVTDPWLVWRSADASARLALAEAMEPEAMRSRLRETRQRLLSPGSGALTELITADPLSLGEVAARTRRIGAGVELRADGRLASADGTAELVLVVPRGQALKQDDARALVRDVAGAIEPVAAGDPGLRAGLTGPHAVSAQMEAMLRRDLERSSVLSSVLASLAFALVFRRVRALAAILPPLLLGTLWTAALASFWPSGLSGVAAAFASVVVGVGFDTGVHVYGALLEARRRGLSPVDAARVARQRTMRPVLVAATIAAVAFASLATSSIDALAQLGLLCAAGELTTALAIVALTPEIGRWLERAEPPAEHPHRIVDLVARLSATKGRALAACVVMLALGSSVLVTGVELGDALVGVRPSSLAALEVEKRIFERFGGGPRPFTVLVEDDERDRAMQRADALAERLAVAPLVLRVDALSSLLPAEATQRARLAERDALDLPARADALEQALRDEGFAPARFAATLSAMRTPPNEVRSTESALRGQAAILSSRYLAEADGRWLVAMQVHMKLSGDEARRALEALVHPLDERALVTGYARLESDLRSTLARELPVIGGLSGALVLGLLVLALRRARDVLLAVSSLAVGVGALLAIASIADIPLHVYSALVLPVLLGISVDEAMFLLYRAREAPLGADPVGHTLRDEGPLVATTALTTSAGFAALTFSDYDGLRHLGWVGTLGSLIQLAVAMLLVPSGLRLLGVKSGGVARGG